MWGGPSKTLRALMMTITLRLFAAAREAAGFDAEALELPPGATVSDAVERLRQRLGERDDVLRHAAFGVNRRYARSETVLSEGDELAILPPVSGG